ncbi:MAG: class I SAM-dependent methyltransferase [Marinibacterium sp.]
MSALARFYTGMDREGPGTAQDVLWALERLDIPAAARICDAGCGSGVDTATLGMARPGARIEAVEKMPHLAGEAAARCGDLPNVTVRSGDMRDLAGPYDLIWCAGALYFLGVREGLGAWRDALTPGGAVAFSEPVLLSAHEPDAVHTFWAQYPAITDLAGIGARVEAAGYAVQDHRVILGEAWKVYYRAMAARIVTLADDPDPDMQRLVAEGWQEIDTWRQVPERIAYALILARPA